MPEQIEIELKTLLTYEEYQRCIDYWQLHTEQAFTQSNSYFDTPDFKLKHLGCGLRIRTLANQAELTLKTPLTEGLLETTDHYSLAEIQPSLKQKTIPRQGAVARKLQSLGIELDELHLLAELTTKRYQFNLEIGEIALDESWYHQQHDYELELEVADYTKGKLAFEKLCQQLSINYKPATNKIARAFQAYGLS